MTSYIRSRRLIENLTITLGVVMLLPACDGIFEDIYDNNKTTTEEKLVEGQFTVDATSYTAWHYLDLDADSINFVTSTIESEETETDIPENWTIALHRYDVKTNGGAAVETDYTSISDLEAAIEADPMLLESLNFCADTTSASKIIIDMSHMMDGYLIYQNTHYNAIIARWLNVDTSTMPPIYTMSHKTYVLRTAEGKYFALYLVNYMNEKSVKGNMTVQYKQLTIEE